MLRTYVSTMILVASLAEGVSGQEDYAVGRGGFIVGGSIRVTSLGGEQFAERLAVVSVSPVVQYFAVPSLAIGGAFDFSYVSGSKVENRASRTAVGIGPRIGYYFGNADSRVYPFLAGTVFVSRVTVGEVTIPQLGAQDGPDGTVVDMVASGGAAFLISRNVGITGEVFYRANLTDIEGQPEALDTNEFGFRFGIAAFVY
jgi:hypothetical protein